MRAFTVSLNGRRLCTAGNKGDGVLTAIVNFVAGRAHGGSELRVGGLRTGKVDEFVDWVIERLGVGDEVRIKIVEAKSIDRPISRRRRNRAADLRAEKRYVRESAKKFGWKIIETVRTSG